MAPRYKFTRRSRNSGALTASSARVTNPSKSFKGSMSPGSANDWQEKNWLYLEKVGELAYYVSWRSKAASRCRLIASELDDSGTPTGTCENERVNEIARDIAGGSVGQAQLLSRMTILLSVPGEGWIAMIVRKPGTELDSQGLAVDSGAPFEEWITLAREEIKNTGSNDVEFELLDGSKHKFVPKVDIFFRVWNPHPRRAREADSPVRSAASALNEIIRADATIDKAGKSRLVGNGIVFVPQEMSLPAQASPIAEPEVPGLDPAPQWKAAQASDLQDLLYNVAKVAVEDPESMAAFIPIFAAAPGEWIKNVTHLKFDSSVSETAIKTRDKAIERLARSLDVTPERLLGLGTNSNHWSAWIIDEQDVKIHVVPVLETICEAINREVFRGALEAEGIDPDLYTVWYDTSALTEDPDLKDEASQAHERGALTNARYLEVLGFAATDGYDLETAEGLKRFAIDKITADPSLISALAPLLLGTQGIDQVKPAPTPAIEQAPEPDAADTKQPPEEPTKDDATDDDPAVQAAAYGLATMCVNRALELANKRRHTRGNHGSFDGVAMHEAHVRLDRVDTDEKAASLIDGWDSIIDPFVIRSSGMDPKRFGELVETVAVMSLRESRRVAVSSNLIDAARSR